jgi:MFS superfamily sulfate permease-like transporter
MKDKSYSIDKFKSDLPAGLIVFLVAVPLCLGIALASGAPLFSGIIAGIVGGIVVGSLSGSPLGVSGPAAGLAVIVLTAINALGFEAFLLAVVIGGIIQLALGYARAGIIGYYFPNSVIKGMLSGIGLIIILKQIPHAFGYDNDFEGSFAFNQPDGETTLSELTNFISYISPGATLLGLISLALLILWEQPFMKKIPIFKIVQGPLVVVTFGILYTLLMGNHEMWGIQPEHMVQIPVLESLSEIGSLIVLPDFSAINNPQVIITGFTIAIVASLETLLCVEATDKLDPDKRITPTNRELKAQGIGNMVSGMLGGLPVTQVIVRSSANIQSGGKTKASAIIHGFLILGFILFAPLTLNMIPLSVLAAVLIVVGFKLAKPSVFKEIYKKGWVQFVPYLVTIVAILLTDLLLGIGIGLVTGFFYILYSSYKSSFFFDEEKYKADDVIMIKLAQETTFLNKATIMDALRKIPDEAKVVIDASESIYIDEDVKELIRDFRDHLAIEKELDLTILKPNKFSQIGGKKAVKAIVEQTNMKPV